MRKFKIVVNGKSYEVEVEELNGNTAPSAARESAPAPQSIPASSGGESVTAPLPGTVWKIKKSAGESVKAGDVLLILEAMKMENEIQSPVDGVVTEVRVQEGAAVDTGQVLVVIS